MKLGKIGIFILKCDLENPPAKFKSVFSRCEFPPSCSDNKRLGGVSENEIRRGDLGKFSR